MGQAQIETMRDGAHPTSDRCSAKLLGTAPCRQAGLCLAISPYAHVHLPQVLSVPLGIWVPLLGIYIPVLLVAHLAPKIFLTFSLKNKSGWIWLLCTHQPGMHADKFYFLTMLLATAHFSKCFSLNALSTSSYTSCLLLLLIHCNKIR